MEPEDIRIEELAEGKSAVCRAILESLPDWFGIPEAIEDYVDGVAGLPMFVAALRDGPAIGFVALKRQTQATVELYVLGLLPDWHGKGIGRRLLASAEAHARAEGARYLSVKTLAAEAGDPNYLRTLQFYEAIGFQPVEVFPTLWSPENPCLLLIKRL